MTSGVQEKIQEVTQETTTFLSAFTENYVKSLVMDTLSTSIKNAVSSAMKEVSSGGQADEGKSGEDAGNKPNEENTEKTDDTKTNEQTAPVFLAAGLIGHTTMRGADDVDYTSYQLVACKLSSDPQLPEEGIPVSNLAIKYARYSRLLSFYTSLVQQLKQENVDVSKLVFPKKKFFGRFNPEFIQTREASLKSFFDEINKNNVITQSQIFQEFFGFQAEAEDDKALFWEALISACESIKWVLPSISELLKLDFEEDKMILTLMHRLRGYHDLNSLPGPAQKAYRVAVGKIVSPQVSATWKAVVEMKKNVRKQLEELPQQKLEEGLKSVIVKILSVPIVKEKLLANKKTDESTENTEMKDDATLDWEKVSAWKEFWEGWDQQTPLSELIQALGKKKLMDSHGKKEWEELFKYELSDELKHFHAFHEIVSRHEHVCKAVAHMLRHAHHLLIHSFDQFQDSWKDNEKELDSFLQKCGLEVAKNIDTLKSEVDNHADHLGSSSASTLADLASTVAGFIGDLFAGFFNKQCVDKKEYVKQLVSRMITTLLQTIEDTTISDASDIIQAELQEALEDIQGLDFLPDSVSSNLTDLPLKILNYIVSYQVKKTVQSQRKISEAKLIQRIVEE